MKIGVTSTGPGLDDMVDARFGRCAFFLVIDPETLEFEPIENPNRGLAGGAGPQSAQLLAKEEVSVVLTGNCGPNALRAFEAAGIEVVTGVSGQVRKAVQEFKSGGLPKTETTRPGNQSEMASGGGVGMGRGMGGGMGRGMGRGMRRGTGQGMGRGGGAGRGRK